ncbi:TlpA family protein disulfide reductase [Zooshikella ganghwensis]|uniref:TlpA family protein disulfide reductase n=1 Tax=Zooshikella ganghwensis TaxID=202772 RepID=UPI00048693E6|nr:TlpA disulfide reductase family protein [Zooshikella ganghwensis]
MTILHFRIVLLLLFCLSLIGCNRPDFYDSYGKPLDITDYQGQWLLINYWAIWCTPCIKEIPELNKIDTQANVSVLGINFDNIENITELQQQVAQLKIAFPVFKQDPTAQLNWTRPQVLPTTLVISPKGKVVKQLVGPQTLESIKQVIAAAQ